MPWHSLSRPSLASGVLRSACAASGLDEPVEYHGALRFAEFLLDRTSDSVRPEDYETLADEGFPHALGDWVFAGALYHSGFGGDGMRDYADRRNVPMQLADTLTEYASEFVDLVVDELLALDVDVIGFTTTFMQNVPSLAAARRLKRRRPDVLTVFGGANCDGPMGVALHREFDAVDLVLRGESDETFPLLLHALTEGPDALATVPGLCWRDATGEQRVNRQGRLVPPAELRAPNFDGWFAAFENSPVSEYLAPELVVESARGCWWGEHHHCTFCGLNGTAMTFRAKPPETFVTEVSDLVARHSVLDVVTVDNILDPGYLRTALPELATKDWDLRLHYEVKANLTTDQIGVLSSAGVVSVQPGIESLVDDVLTRMDKGVRAVHNVRTMRDCESNGLTVTWNWLYGFPGEREDDYRAVLDQVPALVHLQPPISATRIQLNRFSPHFENPDLGFEERAPAEAYRYVYDIPQDRLNDLVYLFDTPSRGLTDEQAKPLDDAVATWLRDYPASTLTRAELDGATVIRDRRAGWPGTDYVLESPVERHAWRELEHGRSVPGLLRKLRENGHRWDEDAARGWLAGLREKGLVFTEGGRWVALATAAAPRPVHG